MTRLNTKIIKNVDVKILISDFDEAILRREIRLEKQCFTFLQNQGQDYLTNLNFSHEKIK